MPPTTQLATTYDASLSVVKLAVGVLRAEGLVIGQQGKGVFVREDVAPAPPASDELSEIRATLRDLSARLERVESRLAERE
ncbi:GntR family transcriptional regulator [Streptosporangium roseum]|uniref:GntR family transcriptional regulator n=1 Tax=Streptosporangium roseum TaxID=2001 RepID=UPI00332B5FDB